MRYPGIAHPAERTIYRPGTEAVGQGRDHYKNSLANPLHLLRVLTFVGTH